MFFFVVGDLYKVLVSVAADVAASTPSTPPQLYNVLFEKYE